MTTAAASLARALDRLQPIIESGEIALPTISAGDGFTIMIAAEPADMEGAFDRARCILVFKGARRFRITGQTAEPEGLYAADISADGECGLFRPIDRSKGRPVFGDDLPLEAPHLAPLAALLPAAGETLPSETEAKTRNVISLHSQLEPGTPLVIRP